MQKHLSLAVLVLTITMAACGGGSIVAPSVSRPTPPASSPVLTSVAITPPALQMLSGATQQFTAQGLDQNRKKISASFTWSCTGPGVVDASGLLTAQANGNITVTATSGNITGSASVIVGSDAPPAVLSKIVVTPGGPVSLAMSTYVSLTATGYDQFGNVFSLADYPYQWNGSDLQDTIIAPASVPNTTTVLVKGVSQGKATLYFELQSAAFQSNVVTFTVTPPPPAPPALTSVNLQPGSVLLTPGQTTTLAASALDQYGNPFPATFTYSVLYGINPRTGLPYTDIADFGQANGNTVQLIGQGVGLVQVIATAGGISSNQVNVGVIPLPSVTLTASASTVQKGQPTTLSWQTTGAQGVTINGSPVAANGSLQATPNVSTVYTLVATGATGTQSTTLVQVTVIPDSVLTSIVVSPATFSIHQGQTVLFSAQGFDQYSEKFPATFSWAATNGETVDNTGLVTGLTPGNATVGAASGSVHGSASLVVVAPVLTSITVSPNPAPSLAVGHSENFFAQGFDQWGNPMAVPFTWISSADATISPSGVATGVIAGGATITASSAGVSSVPVNLTVIPLQPGSIFVQPLSDMLVNGTQQAQWQVFDQFNQPMAGVPVLWSSSNPAATIDSNGKITAVSAGSVTVTASVSGVTSNPVSFTVRDFLSSIVVSPNSASIPAGQTQLFGATGYDEKGKVVPNVAFVWASDGKAVTINSNGFAFGVDTGSANVTASATGANGLVTSLPVPVTVTAVLTTITVTSPVPSIYTGSYGSAAQLSAVAKDQDGNVMQVPFTWSSDNQAVASVNSAGLVTGLTPGTANIQAASGSVSGQFNIAVVQEPSFLSTVIVSPGSGSTHVDGSTVQFTAVALDEYNNILASVPFTWSSTAPATVDSTGLATGVSAGVATIQASATLFSPELNRNFTVTSNPATLAVGSVPMLSSITLSPATVSLAVVEPIGELPNSTPLTATALDQYQELIQETYTWTSDAPAVASVDGSGNVTGLTVGTAHIWASSEGVNSTQTTVSVTNAPSVLTYLTVNPTALTQYVGVVTPLTASPADQFHNPMAEQLSWSTSDSTVATADANGNVTAVAPGTATITVETGTLFAQSSVTVAAEPTISGMYEFNVAGGPLIEASLVQVGTVIEAYKAPNGCLTAVTLAPKSVSQICSWVTQTVGSSSANVVNLYILGLPSKGSFDANGNLSGPGWTATQVQPISGLWTGSISLNNGACTATSVNFTQANNSQVSLTGCGTFTFNQIANYTTWTQGNDLELSYTNGASLQFTNLTFSLFGDNGILTQQ